MIINSTSWAWNYFKKLVFINYVDLKVVWKIDTISKIWSLQIFSGSNVLGHLSQISLKDSFFNNPFKTEPELNNLIK